MILRFAKMGEGGERIYIPAVVAHDYYLINLEVCSKIV